jgi:hypothetical protein
MAKTVVKSILLALLIALVAARPALAYIDPNVGGQLFQILAAGFAVFSGMALLFSRHIRAGVAKARRFIRERLGGSEEGQEDADE